MKDLIAKKRRGQGSRRQQPQPAETGGGDGGRKVDVDSEKIDREKAALREPNNKVWCRSVASRPVSLKVLNKGIEAGCRHRREAP